MQHIPLTITISLLLIFLVHMIAFCAHVKDLLDGLHFRVQKLVELFLSEIVNLV